MRKVKAKKPSVEVVATLWVATPRFMRAQDRLNRAAVAWAHIYAETIKDPWKYSDRLVRAVRAFQKARAVRVEIYAVRAKKAGGR